MKKLPFLSVLIALLLLAGCGPKPAALNPETAPQPNQEQDGEEFDPALACSYLCERKIPELCEDYIAEQSALGLNLDETIYEESSCQLSCEAEWDEATIACVTDADECAQLSNDAPNCIDDSEEDGETPPRPGNCVRACENYTVCVSYGDDISPADIHDAFASCMEVCGTWEKSAIDCLANTSIIRPGDCAAQTACLLPAVNNLMNKR